MCKLRASYAIYALLFPFMAFILLLSPTASFASNKVSSPDITKGQVELEYRGGYDFDDTTKLDGQQTHKFSINDGVTDRWRPEIRVVASGNSDNLKWTSLELNNRIQIFKDKEWWVKLAFDQNIKFALLENKPDKIEIKTLASKDWGTFTHSLNVSFENEIGSNARGGTDLNWGWKSKYRYASYFEPGVEMYGDFGKFGTSNSVTPDKFQLGPVFSGKFSSGVKYEVGYLFGLNQYVPDERLKLILTYGF